MILKLPLELREKIFSYLKSTDLLELSNTCKSIRQNVLEVLHCENCHRSKKAAICEFYSCHDLICERCFRMHFKNHLYDICPSNFDFHFPIITKVKNNMYTFTVKYADVYEYSDFTEEEDDDDDDDAEEYEEYFFRMVISSYTR